MMSDDAFSIPSSLPDGSNPNPKTSANQAAKKKRNLPGTPDPDAEVIALSPKTLMATNRFVCEICNKGFQRDQNLQLHRRGHNLPWKLRQRTNKEVRKKVYICPEKTCVHHDPSRALGDLTGVKKHFSRKHGEKKWKCEKCSKKYAVQSDWKAHSKTCGTREYKCDCGTLFSRKDSFITHRAFCDALAEESARITSAASTNLNFSNDAANLHPGFSSRGVQDIPSISQFGASFRPEFNGIGGAHGNSLTADQQKPGLSLFLNQANSNINPTGLMSSSDLYASSSSHPGLPEMVQMGSSANLYGSSSTTNYGNLSLSGLPQALKEEVGKEADRVGSLSSFYSENQNKQSKPATPMSATALLQKAAQMGSTRSNQSFFSSNYGLMNPSSSTTPNLNAFDHSRNELQEVFQNVNKQPESSTPTNSTVEAIMRTSTSLDQLVMRSSGKQSDPSQFDPRTSSHIDKGLTRDFLGVTPDSGRTYFSPQLAKFASMSSAMGLDQFAHN
ncbi:hypothetical protein K2173_001999 [Erythroxylum novogranatense]|uniref:C2H2-type domain-containing protein n=1 Tax=Erythroxylum novogranatense TaxID=1862640 RepID=A0AAV8SP89_9ROSI|nr:hypothetical protein K2173_001999 [Erythroxylum novogranatense]